MMLSSKFQLAIRPRFCDTSFRGFWELPAWLGEHYCTVFQDLYRMTTLIKAAGDSAVSRPLQADAVRFFRNHDPMHDRIPLKVLVRGTLHSTSQTCVCAAHLPLASRRAKGSPKRVDFEMEMCGLPLDADGSCSVHRTEHDARAFPGATVCTCNLKARIACRHQDGQTMALDFPPDLWADEDMPHEE